MKNIFFNWNKIVSNKVFLFSFFLFSSQINFAQCTISSFTVAPTNATCFSNGEIKVSIPTGQSGCTGNVRLIPVTGANNTPVPSQTQQLTVPSSGGEVVFSSLPAGKYNIETFDGFTTYNYASNPVTITSSYTPMTLNLSSTAPTCAAGTTGYVANGTFTATVVGGTGPFEYTLTSASGVQTVNSTSRTQVFNTIQAGETVTIVVTDKVNNNPGCQVSVTQTHVTSTAVPAPLAYGIRAYNFIRECVSNTTQYKIKFYVNLANLSSDRLAILQQDPLNAKITIAGVDYPLTYLPARNGYTYEPATVNGPELVHGMSITTSFNWGCSTLTRTSLVHMPDNYFNMTPTTVSDANCNLQLRLRIFGDQDHTQGGITDRNIYFCPTNTVKIERRVSISPEIYEEVTSPNISPDPYASTNDLNVLLNPSNPTIPSSSSDWFLNEGGYYKITVSDASHTVDNYYNAPVPLVNPVSTLNILPTASLLSGTSGFNIPLLGSGVKYPLKVIVERTDGLTTVNHTATQPLSYAGTYTYNFPMEVTWNSSPDAYGSVYDLPPGEYRFTISDACSNTNSVTKVLTSTNPALASYNPTFTVTQGCNNSNSIAFSLNRNGFAFGTNWTPSPDVYLYTKSATGGLGTYLKSVARTNNLAASGTFSNLASGSYFIQFNGIGLGYSAALKTFSPPPLNYIKEITIPDYQNFTVSTGASICDASSANTGIISAQITGGTYTYPIIYSLFSTSNPSTPIATHTENDTTKTEHSFTGLATGNYFVRVASSCYSVDQNVSISTNATAPQAIVSDPVVCPMTSVTLGAISATNGLYDITWTDDADSTQTVLATGMPVVLSPANTIKYRATFKLKDLGCANPPVYTSTVDVRVDPNPDVTLAVSDINLCLAPANKTVTISNAQNGYKYELVKSNNESFIPQITGTGTGSDLVLTIPSTENLAVGTTLKVKTSNGANSKCTDYLTDVVNITQSTPDKTLRVVPGNNVCQGFSSTIKVETSQPQVLYLVKKNGVAIASIPTQTGNGSDLTFTIPANQLVVGANVFTIQASNTSCGTTDLDYNATINVTASPVANAGTPFIKTCIDNPTGKQIGMTGVSGIRYSWSPSTGLNEASLPNPIANPTATTTYTLTAADGTCTATSTVKVTVIKTVPSVNAGADFTKTCSVNPSGKLIGTTIQGESVTYSWSPSTGLTGGTTIATPNANPDTTTTYTVTTTETNSGCTSSDEVVVTVDKTPPANPTIASIEHPTCLISTGTITVNATGNTNDSYSIDDGATFQSSNIFNNVSVGTHLVKIKSGTNGCISNATSAIINPQPVTPSVPTITEGSATTFCQGGSVVLTSSATTGNQWYKDNVEIVGATDQTYTASVAGTYSVVVTNNDGCSSSASVGVIVTVNALPVATINNGVTLAFVDCSATTIDLTASNGSGFEWYYSPDNVTAFSALSDTNQTITATNLGFYKVKVINSTNCEAESQVTQVVAKPAVLATDLVTCVGNTVTLEANTASFVSPTYQWKKNGNNIVGATIQNWDVTEDGIYTVEVTDGRAIGSIGTQTSCGANVKFNPLPVVDAGTDFTITCATNVGGQIIGETPETGFTYAWTSPNGISGLSNAAIANPRANPAITTTYTVRKTNQTTLCWKEDTITITVDTTVPVANAGIDFTKTCIDNTLGREIGVLPISGVTYSWLPTTDLDNATKANPIANPTVTTTYTVTATNTVNGCYATDTVVATVDVSAPTANAGTDFTKTCGTNLTGKLIGTTAQSGTIYSWFPTIGLSNAAIANPNANPSVTTEYTVTATKSATGCTATDTVTITVLDTPNPVAQSSTIANNCPIETVDLSTIQPAAVNGMVYEWWTGTATSRETQITNPTTYATPGTIYLWSKTASEGCYNTTASEVNVVINVCCLPSAGSILSFDSSVQYAPAEITFLRHRNFPIPSVVRYVIVNDLDGKIKQVNPLKPQFTEIPAGNYTVHALVFGPAVAPIGLEIGNTLSQVQPFCGTSATYSITVSSSNCLSDSTFSEVIPNVKQYALLNLSTSLFDQINSSGLFSNDFTGTTYQIIGFNYTGTPSGIEIGSNIAAITATDLEIIPGAVVRGCAAVTTQIDGNVYNDKEKRCVEGLNNKQGFPAVTLYAKLLNSNNQVISVSSAIQAPDYTFSMSSDLLDGVYTIILDNNQDTSDEVATYPTSWKGNAQTFTIESGQIVEYLSNTANFVPMCLQSATNKPTPTPTANLVGNTYNFCQGATASSVTVDSISGATVNWYTQATGGVANLTSPVTNTAVVGSTTYYVSQTVNGAESDRTEINIVIHALPEQPTAIDGTDLVGAGTSQNYFVVNGSSGLTYNWILPTDWTGSSTSENITVQVGTKDATIGVVAISPFGCESQRQELDVRVVIEDDIEVYNSLSPNGDGDNDIFRIRNIDFYPENTLSIFNRWGIEVYSVTSYGQNDNFFRGFSDGRSTINRDTQLPEGTYFYTLTYKNLKGIERNLSGYLYIKQ